jgi:uncharacterized membrane protein YqhA
MGLALSIGILLIKFVQELIQLAVKAFVASEADIILGVLTLVDSTPYEDVTLKGK